MGAFDGRELLPLYSNQVQSSRGDERGRPTFQWKFARPQSEDHISREPLYQTRTKSPPQRYLYGMYPSPHIRQDRAWPLQHVLPTWDSPSD
ncbi:uncharacterized protein METZ01_LOCUS260266, partial [marine metagenome]